MMRQSESLVRIKAALGILFAINLFFWLAAKEVYVRWSGVPPVPTRKGAVMMTLGDPEFSYRFLALALQNLGDVGRDVTPLKDYNYQRLGEWFALLHALDPASDHVPMIAAYYFGATQVPKDAAVVVDYLQVAGQIPVGTKWRWLAHAAYMAQHRVHDLQRALDLAYRLVKMPNAAEMPQWARQMPAFILNEKGDRAASRQMMENLLLTEKNVPWQEVNFMKSYLIEQLGVPPEEVEQIMRLREGGK